MAPELYTRGQTHDQLVDIWALGVLCFLLLTHKHPFHNNEKQVDRIKIKTRDPDYGTLEGYSLEAESFLRSALTRDK